MAAGRAVGAAACLDQPGVDDYRGRGGLWQGLAVGSIALTGWALGSAAEGMASVIVVWRFTGSRTLSENAERRAQRGVAVSFWLIAPYIAAESIRDLLGEHRAETTLIGIVLVAIALLEMPLLGYAKHKLGARLGSAATAGEGTQNYLCAAQAAAVLVGLAVTASWQGGWWLDPVIGRMASPLLRSGKASNPGAAMNAGAEAATIKIDHGS
jgi:divalent metal cation (Fe/Co/Zn/Cd) transporter